MTEMWLTDASRCAYDVFSLAGPGLSIEKSSRSDTHIRYTVGLHANAPVAMPPPSRGSHPPDAWQAGAVVTSLRGHVSLDASTGSWSEAAVELNFRVSPREARASGATGRVQVEARFTPLAKPPRWPVPETSVPMPARRRLTHEAQSLLDGLARP